MTTINEALASIKVGDWYGDGQCYALTGQYVWLLTGKDISYSNKHPMLGLKGAGSHAVYIAEDWDWASVGFEVIIEPTDVTNIKVGDIVNIAGFCGFPWYALSEYGHTAVISRIVGDTIFTYNQNYATDGNGGAVVELSMARPTFLDGIHSIVRPPQEGTSTNVDTNTNLIAETPKIGANSSNNTDKSKELEKLFTDFKSKMTEFFKSLQGYLQGNNMTNYTNTYLTIEKMMNLYNAKISTGKIEELNKALDEILIKIKEENKVKSSVSSEVNIKESNKSNIVIEENEDESTEELRAKLITKLCKKYCPTSNPYGVAGLIGNFSAESSITAERFESDYLCTLKPKEITTDPTVEFAFDSWSSFSSLYAVPLNESVYLVDGKHYMGLGLGQWTGTRAKALWDFAGRSDKMWTVKTQMEFAFTGDGSNGTILQQCLTNSEWVEEGVENVYKYWERANVGSSVATRNAKAHEYYDRVVQWLKE